MHQVEMSEKVTLRDVAALAGCSPSAATAVLNDSRTNVRVSESTRERVLAAAATLNYRRNQLARAMITGKNQVFGFLTPHAGLDVEFKGRVLAGAFREANRQAYLIKVLYIEDDLTEAIEKSLEYCLAGLITLSLSAEINASLRAAVAPHSLPVAVIGDIPGPDGGVQVVSDDEAGMASALDHLRSLGHRNIAFLSGQAGTSIADWRRRVFARQMHAAGLDVPHGWNVAAHWWNIEVNETAVRELLSGPDRPTAIMAAGDMAAVVAQRTARKMGLRVPEDLSVTGFGDFTLAPFADPPLTTVAQPFDEMGAAAVRYLLSAPTESSVLLPTSLVVRESTGPAPL